MTTYFSLTWNLHWRKLTWNRWGIYRQVQVIEVLWIMLYIHKSPGERKHTVSFYEWNLHNVNNLFTFTNLKNVSNESNFWGQIVNWHCLYRLPRIFAIYICQRDVENVENIQDQMCSILHICSQTWGSLGKSTISRQQSVIHCKHINLKWKTKAVLFLV